jgi:hypothetical protein
VGDWIVGGSSRQHSDLTRPTKHHSVLRTVVLSLLALDGVLSAIFGALLLPSRIGSVPFPISALISGVVNGALVWAGLQWTSDARLGAIALWTWLATLGGLALGGPGGDVVFGGSGFDEYALLVLLGVGALPPGWVLWRRTRSKATD